MNELESKLISKFYNFVYELGNWRANEWVLKFWKISALETVSLAYSMICKILL